MPCRSADIVCRLRACLNHVRHQSASCPPIALKVAHWTALRLPFGLERPVGCAGGASYAGSRHGRRPPGDHCRRANLTRARRRPLACSHEIPEQGIAPPPAYSSAESGKTLGHSNSPYFPVFRHAGSSPGRGLPPAPGERRFLCGLCKSKLVEVKSNRCPE